MALMEVNFFSKALMRPVTMNVILPADKVFFEEETEEENKPFKTLYLLHGVMGNYTDWVTGTCIKRWAEEKNLAVVMPSGANMFYMDHPNANENYSEFIGKELVKITLQKAFFLKEHRGTVICYPHFLKNHSRRKTCDISKCVMVFQAISDCTVSSHR